MKNGEDILKEMLGKRPDELEGETLKLFEAIMKIANSRDELKARNKELESDLYSANCIISEQIDIIRDSIPKSKVIEKIEERKSWLCSNDIAYKDDYVLEVLQELLEEVGG